MRERELPGHSVVAALLLLVLGAGLAAGIAGLALNAAPSRPGDRAGETVAGLPDNPTAPEGGAGSQADPSPVAARPAPAAILDGTRTSAFETKLEETILLREPAVTLFAALRYALFRSGNIGVVAGRNGWLFTLEELEHHPSDDAELMRRLVFVAGARDELRERGTEVVVALLPSKARVHSEMLRGRWRSLSDHPRYNRALRWLADHGVPVANLLPALREGSAAFLVRDTHWTPDGAAAAAREVARVTASLSLAGVDRTDFQTIPGKRVSVAGDLMNFVPVGAFADLLGLGEQRVQLTETVQTSTSGLGLFDTPRIPVTLVGTSYSADERWNFVGELKESLQMDVLNVAAEGEGPFVPMRDYLAGEAFAEVRPALVIWEIPERYLTLPDVEVPPGALL